MQLFYSQLASWWPLISPVEDYREEAGEFLRVLGAAHPSARTLLELGSGGGHNAYYFKNRYQLTLTDLSAAMLEQSAQLNPECEHIEGDMRTLALARQFDLVFLHDAVDYMTSEADLVAAIATAYRHCRPGGVALFVPDVVAEDFEPDTDCGGSDGADGRSVRLLVWSYQLDPSDSVGVTHYQFLLREPDGSVRSCHEAHEFGMFSRQRWLELLEAQGFTATAERERTSEERKARWLFVARRAG
jgi:SAM-dependent methyltransferase